MNYNQTEVGYSNNTTQREALIFKQASQSSNQSSAFNINKPKSPNSNLKYQKQQNIQNLATNGLQEDFKDDKSYCQEENDQNCFVNFDEKQVNQLNLFKKFLSDSQIPLSKKCRYRNQDFFQQQQNIKNKDLENKTFSKSIREEQNNQICDNNFQSCGEFDRKQQQQFQSQQDDKNYNQAFVSANFICHDLNEGKLSHEQNNKLQNSKNSVRDFNAIIRSKNISFSPSIKVQYLEQFEKQNVITFEDFQGNHSSQIQYDIQSKADQQQSSINQNTDASDKINKSSQQKDTSKNIDISQSLRQETQLKNNFNFFKEILDFLDSSLFVVDERLQIIYSNHQASQLSERLYQSFNIKGKQQIINYQKKKSRNSNDNCSMSNPFFIEQRFSLVDYGQVSQFHYHQTNDQLKFQSQNKIQQIANLQQDQKSLEKRELISQNVQHKSFFQLNQVQSKNVIENQRNQFLTWNNIQSKDKLSFNKILFEKNLSQTNSQNQDIKYNLLKHITVFEFSKQSLSHLKKMGINQNSPLNSANIQKSYQDEKNNFTQTKNQIFNSLPPAFSNKFNSLHQSQPQSFNYLQKLDCSYLLEDVLIKECKRSERTISIHLFDLIKTILQNLSLEYSHIVIEPVSIRFNGDFDILNHFVIKLIGKFINNQKCVIIAFSDNQEKGSHLNKVLERNLFQTISHELGTYTNFIQTFTQTALLDQSVPASVKHNYLKVIYFKIFSQKQFDLTQTIKYMDSNIFLVSQVIQDIRDYYEFQNDALKIIWKEVNLAELIQKICKHFKKLAKIKQITFKCEVLEIPEKICTDQQKTQSILINLLSNAFKFSHKNGQVTIEISYDKEDEQIKISVQDLGIGNNQLQIQLPFIPLENIQ